MTSERFDYTFRIDPYDILCKATFTVQEDGLVAKQAVSGQLL